MNIVSKSILLLGLVFFSHASFAAEEKKGSEYHEGFEYIKIVPPQPTQVKQGEIEVIEVFWYGCPHCFRFEPFLNKWLKTKPKNVVFIRIPAMINPGWEIHARAFYTAELLNLGEKIHKPLFDAIHVQKKKLSSKESVAKFFTQYGVDEKKFTAVYDSFQVEMKIKRAQSMIKKYGVYGVPTMIVNGKYRVGATNADQSFEKLIKILDYLIEKEKKGS